MPLRSLLVVLVLSLSVATVTGCASHRSPNITTDQGKTAYTADQVLVRVGELQAAAIQAEATGGITTAQARAIVGWTTPAARVLKETPNGYQASVTASWVEAKKKIGTPTNPAVLAAIATVDVALATLGGQ